MNLSRQRTAYQAGFTMIELLVVLVILGMLAGFAVPKVMDYLAKAKVKTAKLQIENFSQPLDTFKLETGRYPNAQEGLQALVQAPGGVTGWAGPYVRPAVIPKDPWGGDYIYTAPGQHGPYDIVSLGADKAPGGEGENADINSWEPIKP